MPTKILLIRHGQTEWNLRKRYCGSADLGLNACGKKEAEKLRKRLKDKPVHKIYSSDRIRAIETARIVFKRAGLEKIPGLSEMHFGIFEGLTYDEIMRKYPVIYKRWLRDPYGITIPKGEGLREFKKRVVSAFKKIIALNANKTVAVVCHGGAISIFLNHILKSKDFWKQIPKSASLSIVEYNNSKPKIRLFNDIAHLKHG